MVALGMVQNRIRQPTKSHDLGSLASLNRAFSKATAGPGRQLQGPRGDLAPVFTWALGVPWLPFESSRSLGKSQINLPRQQLEAPPLRPCFFGSIEKPCLPHYLSSYNIGESLDKLVELQEASMNQEKGHLSWAFPWLTNPVLSHSKANQGSY